MISPEFDPGLFFHNYLYQIFNLVDQNDDLIIVNAYLNYICAIYLIYNQHIIFLYFVNFLYVMFVII